MSLEEQSFKNLVHFYCDELRQVLEGKPAVEVFNTTERAKLQKWRILLVNRNKFGKIIEVNPEAEVLL